MRDAETILGLIRERGKKGLPLERVYKLLYNQDLYLMAYGKIYRNKGAMTHGVTEETPVRPASLVRQTGAGSHTPHP
jgi:hypothetical protein